MKGKPSRLQNASKIFGKFERAQFSLKLIGHLEHGTGDYFMTLMRSKFCSSQFDNSWLKILNMANHTCKLNDTRRHDTFYKRKFT